MNKRRKAEAFSGLTATLLAFVAFVYLLFGPVYSFADSTGTSGTASMLQALQTNAQHIQPIAIMAFCTLLLGIIGVGVSAVCHSRTQKKEWQNILLFSVCVIVIFTLLALLSIGPLMTPSAVFALFALFLSYEKEKEAVTGSM